MPYVLAFPMLWMASAGLCADVAARRGPEVLDLETVDRYVDSFNAEDEQLYAQHIPNAQAASFLRDNIPLFDCPDDGLERTYYFRWWTYRKHIKQTPDGFVVTEFLPPVPWAGKYNTISCPAGHHFREGRWLHDPRYLDDYSTFWFRRGGDPRRYSFWAADAIYARHKVSPNHALIVDLLDDLVANYRAWETSRRGPNGLFWQIDGRDGMEVSIGGSGYRATINSYMIADALAIAEIARCAGRTDTAREFRAKAAEVKHRMLKELWDPRAEFFKVKPRSKDGDTLPLAQVRELHGYTPWYFSIPTDEHSAAWRHLMDPNGFYAPYGPTTAERRHPRFAVSYEGHECQWSGPSWPFATSVTLTALANLLNHYDQDVISKEDYFELLRMYARSHLRTRSDGKVVPWIDENLNPFTGDWIARTRLKQWNNGTWDPRKGGKERGKDYNHSTFCDLIITGLVGLRPRTDDIVVVNPLVPDDWDWFCLDNVLYHNHLITILWDKTGSRYKKGKGFQVLVDGKRRAAYRYPRLLTLELPPSDGEANSQRRPTAETAAGWRKHDDNPVLGGDLGTCFDVALLKEDDRYRMWFSWRPKKSIALTESPDGIHWGEPVIVLGPNSKTDWEAQVNRPVVLRRTDGYHMWYTGQARGRSWIGYARSTDGRSWQRADTEPVISPTESWEQVAVMCPHVIWDDTDRLFRMWYSAGEQYEPDAIGLATSPDGKTWTKHPGNPIFKADRRNLWEQDKVTACQVVRDGPWYLMFYIGFRDVHRAQIGVARSPDGLSNWQRHPANPVISPGRNRWDHDACYKPFAIFDPDEDRWLLWYNGRRGASEQIGLALHLGRDLGFPTPAIPDR